MELNKDNTWSLVWFLVREAFRSEQKTARLWPRVKRMAGRINRLNWYKLFVVAGVMAILAMAVLIWGRMMAAY